MIKHFEVLLVNILGSLWIVIPIFLARDHYFQIQFTIANKDETYLGVEIPKTSIFLFLSISSSWLLRSLTPSIVLVTNVNSLSLPSHIGVLPCSYKGALVLEIEQRGLKNDLSTTSTFMCGISFYGSHHLCVSWNQQWFGIGLTGLPLSKPNPLSLNLFESFQTCTKLV